MTHNFPKPDMDGWLISLTTVLCQICQDTHLHEEIGNVSLFCGIAVWEKLELKEGKVIYRGRFSVGNWQSPTNFHNSMSSCSK